jgi:hypothetical protein
VILKHFRLTTQKLDLFIGDGPGSEHAGSRMSSADCEMNCAIASEKHTGSSPFAPVDMLVIDLRFDLFTHQTPPGIWPEATTRSTCRPSSLANNVIALAYYDQNGGRRSC